MNGKGEMISTAYFQSPAVSPQSCYFKIADVSIAMLSHDPELRLCIEGATEKFIVDPNHPDVRVFVRWADRLDHNGGKKLFDAGGLWQLYQQDGDYRFCFSSSTFDSRPYKVALFNSDFSAGEVHLQRDYFPAGKRVYPLEYPLDELLVMNWMAADRGAVVHGCGLIDSSGKAFLFIGQSGAGKTTSARLWQKHDHAEILSDDRIILRKAGGGYRMYGTPWHGEAELASPNSASVAAIFFLQHGPTNEILPQGKAGAVAHLFACSFPPFYSRSGLDFTLRFYQEMAEAVPCYQLQFTPDHTVVEFIQQQRLNQ